MKFTKALSAFLSVALILVLNVEVFASGGPDAEPVAQISGSVQGFDVPCRNAILITQDGTQVFYEKDADTPVPIASITKVMTLLLTFEALQSGKVNYKDFVPVSEHAYSMGGSQIWLEPGEQFTLDEMLKAICVSSANDAAVAVAEFIGGSEPVFVEMMNKKAAELGMKNSTFKNACGLDEDGHLSSARDVSIMSRALLSHEEVTKYTTIWMDSLRGGATQLLNTNKLLKKYSGINGLKTGTTGKAGICISASAQRDGLSLIAVVLGSASSNDRFDSAMNMLDYGFANYESAQISLPPDCTQALPVKLGAQKLVDLEYTAPSTLVLKKGEGSKMSVAVNLPEFLTAPLDKGVQVGTVVISIDGKITQEYPINTKNAIDKMNFGTAFGMLLKSVENL